MNTKSQRRHSGGRSGFLIHGIDTNQDFAPMCRAQLTWLRISSSGILMRLPVNRGRFTHGSDLERDYRQRGDSIIPRYRLIEVSGTNHEHLSARDHREDSLKHIFYGITTMHMCGAFFIFFIQTFNKLGRGREDRVRYTWWHTACIGQHLWPCL